MSPALIIHSAGPGVTVQDLGREGYLAQGLSRGGAADRLAVAEGAALLGQDASLAVLEMAGFGGVFEPDAPMRVALTGAPMRATVDGETLVWNASHTVMPGQHLSISTALKGVYGYLHVGGGIDTPMALGSRSAHLTAGIGAAVAAGDRLPVGKDRQDAGRTGMVLSGADRFRGGVVRVVPSAQTHLFPDAQRARFEATGFTRDARGNRQGVRLAHGAEPFAAEGQLSILSEVIVPGDIQMTGDGTPYVLLPECQTMGGYPRIGTVVPEDLPIVAQAAPGTILGFRFVTLESALQSHRQSHAQAASDMKKRLGPLVRDPRKIQDLLSFQLISGVISGMEPDE
ncbi:MAG: urea amidolyase [Rhodobacteraceae bacterium]|nr:urea amidolyase [Paracoccaceae bacterium]MCP5342330.1 urea amidolyase [Paracoccaceae bacterium]